MPSAAHRFRLLAAYLKGSLICPGLPNTGIIATTHRCNMTCRMCIRAVRSFSGPDMDFDLFKKIIDQWIPYLRYLSLDGPGETIMHPGAFEKILYAKSKGIRVMLSTNATLLDGDTVDAILDSNVDLIIFSVNGVTADVYEAVHGRSSYQEVLVNIHRFLERKLARKAPVQVSVQMVRLPETLPQVEVFYRRWKRVPGVDYVRIKKDVMCNEGACLNEAVRRVPRRNPCSRLWHGPVYVETNGDVYPSPGVLYKADPIGNLRDQSLAAIWNGRRMQAMRQAHVLGSVSAFPECSDCAYPRPLLPMILGSFFVDPFTAGKLVPLAEKLAFWHRFPLFETAALDSGDHRKE